MGMKNACGTCLDCKREHPKYCDQVDILGVTINGAAAEYMLVDSDWIIHLPPNLTFEKAAPLMCSGMSI